MTRSLRQGAGRTDRAPGCIPAGRGVEGPGARCARGDVVRAQAPRARAVRRAAAALGAFFLAVCVSAHALDEYHDRPLGTALSRRTLVVLASVGLGGALAIGIAGVVTVSVSLLPFVVLGGRFHNDLWFALAWGGFPALTGFWVNALAFDLPGLLVAAACCLLSAAQRRLSTPVRELRRRTTAVRGEHLLSDWRRVELSAQALAMPLERALSALSLALVLLAVGLLAVRL